MLSYPSARTLEKQVNYLLKKTVSDNLTACIIRPTFAVKFQYFVSGQRVKGENAAAKGILHVVRFHYTCTCKVKFMT